MTYKNTFINGTAYNDSFLIGEVFDKRVEEFHNDNFTVGFAYGQERMDTYSNHGHRVILLNNSKVLQSIEGFMEESVKPEGAEYMVKSVIKAATGRSLVLASIGSESKTLTSSLGLDLLDYNIKEDEFPFWIGANYEFLNKKGFEKKDNIVIPSDELSLEEAIKNVA